MSEFDNQNQHSEDNVWTSYSDMFTTMAIIFLVMFVFALIKAGVSTVTVNQVKQNHKKELEGKMTPQMKAKQLKDRQVLSKSIQQMDKYEEKVNQKIQELTKFVSGMKSNKFLVKKVIDQSVQKDLALEKINTELNKRKKLIAQQQKENKKRLEEITKLQKLMDNNQKIYTKKIEQSNKKISKLEQSISQKDSAIAEKKQRVKELVAVKHDLNNKIRSMASVQIAANQQQIKLNKKIEKLRNNLTKRREINRKLEVTVKKKNDTVAQIAKENVHYQQVIKNKSQIIEQTVAKLEKSMRQYNQSTKTIEENRKVIASSSRELRMLKRERNNLEGKLTHAQKNLKSQSKAIKKHLESIKGLTSTQKILERELHGSRGANVQLQSKLAGMSEELSKSQGMRNKLAKSLKGLRDTKNSLERQLSKLEGQFKHTTAQAQKSEASLGSAMKSLKGLKAVKNSLEGELASLAEKFEKATGKAQRSEAVLNARIKKLQRKLVQRRIASVEANKRANYRGVLANKLAEKFRKANLNVRVNPKTGNIILGVGTKFLFRKNSDILSSYAKKTLKKIIPLYSATLLGDKDTASNISTFNITGHASPTYRGKCVNPKFKNTRAYNYNLHLSSMRAESVTKYLFSTHSFDFVNKWEMRGLTNSVGKSFSEPILLNRSIASQKESCFGHDVKNSQRVELSFTLKDNLKIRKSFRHLEGK